MSVNAIVFDFYGVISSDDLWDFVGVDKQSRSQVHELADQVNLGQLDWDEYCKKLSIASDRRLEEINTMYWAYRINRNLIGYIGQLKQNYKIGLLTNANRGHIEAILEEIGAQNDFDAVVVSADVGMIKPQPRIYKEMLRRLSVEAEEAVFIDDAAINVEGAEAVGMKAILFENTAQLRTDLEKVLSR